MACYSTINLFPATVAFLLTFMLAVGFTSQQPEAAGGCSDQLVAFSPCLPYISAPPNNESFTPSSNCCGVLSADFNAGNASCLCYLVRQPLILGFPLNSSRLNSLASLCPPSTSGLIWNGSLESLCSGLSALPPLQAITNPGTSKPREFGNITGHGLSPSPMMSSMPAPAYSSSPESPSMPAAPHRPPLLVPNSIPVPESIPSTANHVHRSALIPFAAIGIVNTCSRNRLSLPVILSAVPILGHLLTNCQQ